MGIIAVGETKLIHGCLMRKDPAVHECHGCAFEFSTFKCPNRGIGSNTTVSIEDGGGIDHESKDLHTGNSILRLWEALGLPSLRRIPTE